MVDFEVVSLDGEPDLEWAEKYILKSKKLAKEYDVVWKRAIGTVFLFLLKRKNMKYEYMIVRLSVLSKDSERFAVVDVMALDKNTIEQIANIISNHKTFKG